MSVAFLRSLVAGCSYNCTKQVDFARLFTRERDVGGANNKIKLVGTERPLRSSSVHAVDRRPCIIVISLLPMLSH